MEINEYIYKAYFLSETGQWTKGCIHETGMWFPLSQIRTYNDVDIPLDVMFRNFMI
jgi:hypothetical protein